MRPNDIPVLEDWITFADAAVLFGISKQGFHKQVFDQQVFDKESLRQLGAKPVYMVRKEDAVREASKWQARVRARTVRASESDPLGSFEWRV